MDLSILDDFQVVQSPVSGRRLDFDEFTDVSTPMQSAYCRQMTEEEYQTMGDTETEKALQVVILCSVLFCSVPTREVGHQPGL